jgi:hypothetical protein
MSEYSSIANSKTDNNALDIDAIYNLKLKKKHNLIQHFITKLNVKCPWPTIMPKQRECILECERKVRNEIS